MGKKRALRIFLFYFEAKIWIIGAKYVFLPRFFISGYVTKYSFIFFKPMFKRISLFFGLMSAVCAQAETVPALVIGSDTKVALEDIVSVKLDASNVYVLKTDGSTVSQSLATLTFGTVDNTEGIREVLSAAGSGSYIVYDLNGRIVKQGNAQNTQNVLSGLDAGTYIVSMGNQSFKVQTNGSVSNARFLNTEVNDSWQTAAPVASVTSVSAVAADVAMKIGLSGIDPMATVATIDSLTFSSDLSTLNVIRSGVTKTFAISDIDQISFPQTQLTVSIQYASSSVEGVNPFYFDGVAITNDGAGVTVNSTYTTDEVEFELSGASSNGYFKYYGEKKFKVTMLGLTLTNPNGPVINSQSGKKGTIKSQNGYTNTLSDGSTYATSDEDQKGCIFSEGQLIFAGKGTLNVLANYKHAIVSDDYVSFENGTVNVLSAVGDAVHAKDSVLVQSGTIDLTCSSDGIDCDGPITIREGENGAPNLTIASDGDGAKGIKTAMDFLMTTGTVVINLTGNNLTTGTDTSKVIGVKADGNITITGGSLTINNSASGGKGLSADGSINISDAATVNY